VLWNEASIMHKEYLISRRQFALLIAEAISLELLQVYLLQRNDKEYSQW
jgi:hypothetical protein